MSFKPYTEKIKKKKIGICSILGRIRIRIQNRTRIRIHHPGSGSADPDPDPHQNDTDPKHWCILLYNIFLTAKLLFQDFFSSSTPPWTSTTRTRWSPSISWWIFFSSCRTSFQSSFWREINLKWFQAPQGHVGLPQGRRQRGLGGVHEVVDGFFFFFMSYIISA